MNFKTLSLVAALLLVAGCAQKATDASGTSGAGSGAGNSSAANCSLTSTTSTPRPTIVPFDRIG